ncbi:hypothetical protein RSO68_01100 [Halomonas saccharevitans]|uniref:Uncharacterized protein n=1 Tax=Halomonas saccharevitans TaxID=416872 RepID=A0ABU3NCV7_9GAMM|nr:hypothetical protein [Halomonas saccharevitans]MDT8878062.1 hypothetical protein [Halomonas saccharevitans]
MQIDPLSARVFADRNLAIRPFTAELNDTFYMPTPQEQPLSRLARAFMGEFRAHISASLLDIVPPGG